MVGYTDFISASPWAETWHFLLGFGIALLVVYLLRLNPLWGALAMSAFIAGVLVKEFWVDLVLEGATVNGGVVDATFFFVGGALGGAVAAAPIKLGLFAATVGIATAVALLFLGAI